MTHPLKVLEYHCSLGVPIKCKPMQYRIVFGSGRRTTLKGTWDYCQFKLERVLRYQHNGTTWVNKHGETASIVAANGIPF